MVVLIDVHAHFLHDRTPRADWRERNASRLRAGEVIQVKIFKHPERLTTLAAAALLSLLSARAATAGPLAISDVPLFLTTGVKPNLIMAIDDSGSMDFEVLLPGNDGSAWWRTGSSGNCTSGVDNNSFTGCIADGR